MILLFLATFLGMEVFAWAMHRYVMHGLLWTWHRSHHEPHDDVLEKNDLFAVVFAAPAIIFVALGLHVWPWMLPIGLGVLFAALMVFTTPVLAGLALVTSGILFGVRQAKPVVVSPLVAAGGKP